MPSARKMRSIIDISYFVASQTDHCLKLASTRNCGWSGGLNALANPDLGMNRCKSGCEKQACRYDPPKATAVGCSRRSWAGCFEYCLDRGTELRSHRITIER